ncbi:MAG TPA: serine/threonine-protein kinase, partial [Gemmataceae bacterium]|nr:serine/threonine-protein kinase [Gemmataceae bacterium]
MLDAARLAELARHPEAAGPSPAALARLVVQRGWLTRFQVNAVAAGRGKDLVLGPYLLLDRLGEGGMGAVYKAHHQHMRRVVALKVIRKEKLGSPEAVQRFYQEVQAAARLHHPNIVLAYDVGQAGATHYFAMEHVEGIDLARLVKERGRLPVAQACEHARQAALGLQHLHEKGLVHRDIKPSNLLLARPAEVIKLLDMGLARAQGAADTGMTRLGAVLGTPDYLAPEQALNSRAADVRTDLYSLGCTLFFLLTGRPPFAGETLTEVLLKHQTEKPPTLAENGVKAPPRLQQVLDRLMAKKPEARYQTPAELIADLAPYCGAARTVEDAPRSGGGGEAHAESVWGRLGDSGEKPAARRLGLSRTSVEGADAGAGVRRRLLLLVGAGVAALLLFAAPFVL